MRRTEQGRELFSCRQEPVVVTDRLLVDRIKNLHRTLRGVTGRGDDRGITIASDQWMAAVAHVRPRPSNISDQRSV